MKERSRSSTKTSLFEHYQPSRFQTRQHVYSDKSRRRSLCDKQHPRKNEPLIRERNLHEYNKEPRTFDIKLSDVRFAEERPRF